MVDAIRANQVQRPAGQRAMRIPEFCARYGIGRTKTYELIAEGLLAAKKCGRLTLILEDEAERLVNSLPSMRDIVSRVP